MSDSIFPTLPPSALPSAAARRLGRGTVWLLVGLQCLLLALVVAAVWLTSARLRQSTLDHVSSHAQVQVHNLEDNLSQSFNLLELHLRALETEHAQWLHMPQQLLPALTALQDKLPYIRSLSVLDDAGRIVVSTQAGNVGQAPALEPLLPVVAPQTPGVLRFGRSWQGRDFADGRPGDGLAPAAVRTGVSDAGFLPLTLVLPEAQQWTLLVAVNNDYFINLAINHEVLPELEQRVYNDRGELLFSTVIADPPGRLLAEPGWLAHIQERQVGSLEDAAVGDERWLAAFRSSRSYPWFVLAQAPERQVLRPWRQNTQTLVGAAGLTLLLVLLVTGRLTWRVRQALQREARLLDENRLAANVFTHSSDLIVITDVKGRIVSVNPAFEQGTGYSAAEALGHRPGYLHPSLEPATDFLRLWELLDAQGHWEGEVTDWRRDGTPLTGWLAVDAVRNQAGQVVNRVAVLRDLSRLRADEEMIRKLTAAVEQSPTSIVITSTAPAIEYANAQFFRSTGYLPEEVIGRNPKVLQSGQTPQATYDAMWARLTAGQTWEGEFINRRKDGSVYIESAILAPLLDTAGRVTHYVGVKYDITAQKEAEKSMRLAEQVIAHTYEGVMICDAAQRIVDINPAFARITGYTREQVLGRNPSMLAGGKRNRENAPALWQALEQQGHWQGEFWNRRSDGALYAASSTISVLRDAAGQVTHYIDVFSDVTQDKHQQEHLERLAHFDALTGLPNRRLLSDRLQQSMARAARQQQQLALCFLDLDGFKAVNDSHGHEAGDDLLVEVARRLEQVIRAGDSAARLGGDEFVVLLSNLHSIDECQEIAQRLLEVIRQPVALADGVSARVGASIGIALYPQDSSDPEQLMRLADRAMYQAKQGGRNRYVFCHAAPAPLVTVPTLSK